MKKLRDEERQYEDYLQYRPQVERNLSNLRAEVVSMKAKVEDMLALVKAVPDLTVHIISGEADGNVRAALAGSLEGTTIACD